MKKTKILGIVIVVLLFGGLIFFASTHKYQDSHLRIEGIRVKLPENTLVVDNCDYENLAACTKTIKVAGKDQVFKFAYKNFKENGYPSTAVASLNGHEFYRVDGLNIEENYSNDFQVFLNFQVIADKYLAFTYTRGTTNRSTTLYVLDVAGNEILKVTELDTDGMLIKDSDEFITFEDNNITLKGSRLNANNTYQDNVNICDVPAKTIVEATYKYTYKDGEFTQKQIAKTTAKDYLKTNSITCSTEE